MADLVALEVVDADRLRSRRVAGEALRGRHHEAIALADVDEGGSELVHDALVPDDRERMTDAIPHQVIGTRRRRRVLAVFVGRGAQTFGLADVDGDRPELVGESISPEGRERSRLDLVALEMAGD